ncbi:MAG TPA: hypothetical protein DIS66_07015 [Candidatus Omnitrophica bacterium]|nr:hypothetical protein [Candidatus Omnitrophota bacterium]
MLFTFLAILCFVAAAYYFIVKKPANSAKAPPAKAESVSAPAVSKNIAIPQPPNDASSKQAIDEIRRELQSVMALNEKINQTHSSKAAQLLKIQEQAVIHQRILANIEQMSSMPTKSMPSREALLAQEKLRIIREETLRNKKTLEKIQPASKTVS